MRLVLRFGGHLAYDLNQPFTEKSWNPKHPFINGCFNWMIPNLYIGNGCFTKHPFINGCLGFQDKENLSSPNSPGSVERFQFS